MSDEQVPFGTWIRGLQRPPWEAKETDTPVCGLKVGWHVPSRSLRTTRKCLHEAQTRFVKTNITTGSHIKPNSFLVSLAWLTLQGWIWLSVWPYLWLELWHLICTDINTVCTWSLSFLNGLTDKFSLAQRSQGTLDLCTCVRAVWHNLCSPRVPKYRKSIYAAGPWGQGRLWPWSITPGLSRTPWKFHVVFLQCLPRSLFLSGQCWPASSWPGRRWAPAAAGSLLLLLQLLMSRQSTTLFLRSLSRDCWEGPGLGIMCKLEENISRTYLKCFLVLQPRFFSKLLSHSSSHCKKSHSGLQHINNLVL